MARLRAVGEAPRSLEQAFGLGPALLTRAAAEQVPWIAASVIEGPAIALGQRQRAGCVVDLAAAEGAGVRVLRRATSGTAAYIGQKALLWTLGLPHVAALSPDASPRTLLNRNVRGFLQGLGHVGAVARYFGREWIAVDHRPAALLAFEVSLEGAVLIEVIAGIDASIAIPAALAAESERAIERWRGKAPVPLAEVLGGAWTLESLADAVVAAVAKRAGMNLAWVDTPASVAVVPPVTDARDPIPRDFVQGPTARVPIGWVETAFEPGTGRVWLGGDVIAPGFAWQAIAAAVGEGKEPSIGVNTLPIEGATVDDLVVAARAASVLARRPPSDPG